MTFPNGGEGGSPTWEKFPHFPVFFSANVPKEYENYEWTWVDTFIFTTNTHAEYLLYIGNVFAQPFLRLCFRLSAGHGADDIAVTRISNGERAHLNIISTRLKVLKQRRQMQVFHGK